MSNFRRHLYSAIVRLHPAAFRNEFGCEMVLDFEEALGNHGFATLCLDALLSLGRQWAECVFLGAAEHGPITRQSLLAGQYVKVSQGCLTLFDLARASVLSGLLFLAIGFAATTPNSRTTISLQAVHASQRGGIYSGGGHRSPAGSAGYVRRSVPANGVAVDRAWQADSGGRGLHREDAEGTEGRRLGMTTRHLSSMGPASGNHLWQSGAFAVFVWLTTLLLCRNPSMGRKKILAVLGFLAVSTPVAFGIGCMIPMYGQILHVSGLLPSFEVATIKPWKPRLSTPPPPSDGTTAPRKVMKVDPGRLGGQPTDRVHMILPIGILIEQAYNLPVGSKRIVGAPDWLGTDQYEIQAKIEDSLYTAMQKMTLAQQREQVYLMEQTLLADRFKLKVHFETREMPVYALVIAKGGPKLTPAKDGESSRLVTLPDNEQETEMTASAVTLDQFVHSPLWGGGGRLVVDQTGLKGTYDFTLKWRSEQLIASGAGQESGVDAPSVFTAIQEQLGLRLVPSKAQVEVIAIDHVEKPSEN